MAFNFNYFKGTTATQAQNALAYWKNALRPVEEVEKMKEEKSQAIAENAHELQRLQDGEPEPANLHELSDRQSTIDWADRG